MTWIIRSKIIVVALTYGCYTCVTRLTQWMCVLDFKSEKETEKTGELFTFAVNVRCVHMRSISSIDWRHHNTHTHKNRNNCQRNTDFQRSTAQNEWFVVCAAVAAERVRWIEWDNWCGVGWISYWLRRISFHMFPQSTPNMNDKITKRRSTAKKKNNKKSNDLRSAIDYDVTIGWPAIYCQLFSHFVCRQRSYTVIVLWLWLWRAWLRNICVQNATN